MKNIYKIIIAVSVLLFIAASCEDFNELTAPEFNGKSGSADLTNFITIGNSLTAGYQSGALFEEAQMYSFPKLIAQQVQTSFIQPLISEPGISLSGGRLEIVSLSPFSTRLNKNNGIPLNSTYPQPYNNLGIPNALLYDVLFATNASNCASAIFSNRPNPLFDVILRNSVLNIGTQLEQALALDPTFISVWIGNNDVLGYAASGGTAPTSPTNLTQFTQLYTALGQGLASSGAQVVVANIPGIPSTPYFTTVGPQTALSVTWYQLAALGVPGLVYQKHGEIVGSGVADSTALLTGGVFLTLGASSYAPLLGTPTGKFYRDNGIMQLPPGIDTTQAFGFHPQNPFPDALVLDPDEITIASDAITNFNSVIASVAASNNFGLVDVNALLNGFRMADFTGGTEIDGITFKTTYVSGGLFSLDGVHPTSQGSAILANEFLKVINTKYSADFPMIDVSTIPGSLPFASKVKFKNGFPQFPPNAFDGIAF